MVTLAGYSIYEELHSTERTSVCRAYRTTPPTESVILKRWIAAFPQPSEWQSVLYEYQTLASLEHPGVIKAYDFVQGRQPLLVLEDTGGRSIEECVRAEPFSIEIFMHIAIKVTEGVAYLHGQKLLHNDLHPAHMIWNAETSQCKLVGFRLAQSFSRALPRSMTEHTLEHIEVAAPEQFASLNRVVDQRSDLYALGNTFFFMLAGAFPFPQQESYEVIHAHLAQRPPSLSLFRPDVPESVAMICNKLLAKLPEKRYQSASGLLHDLKLAQRQLTQESPPSFSPGQRDISDIFSLTQALIGRRSQWDALQQAWWRISEGESEWWEVKGAAGMGKSKFALELQETVASAGGHWVYCKFLQHNTRSTYTAITRGLEQLKNTLLMERASVLATLREELQKALGSHLALLVQVFPCLAQLFGEQEQFQVQEEKEVQVRLSLIFKRFLHCLSLHQGPLMIVLDDIQWIDDASLQLLRASRHEPQSGAICWITCSRTEENEFSESAKTFARWNEQLSSYSIELGPFTEEEVQAYLNETLHTTHERLLPLTQLCYQKTKGHPLFLGKLLTRLYQEDLLTFSHQKQEWSWDEEQIRSFKVFEHVAELIISNIEKLSPEHQDCLKFLSCLGSSFSLHQAAIFSQLSSSFSLQWLEEFLEKEFLVMHDTRWKSFVGNALVKCPSEELRQANSWFQFSHDRIHQTVYYHCSAQEHARYRECIGTFLLRHKELHTEEHSLFALAGFLDAIPNEGLTQEDRSLAASLCLRAASFGVRAVAFAKARDFCLQGISILSRDAWETHYECNYQLSYSAIEACYFGSFFQQMEALVESTLPHLRSDADTLRIQELLLLSYMARGLPSEGVKYGLSLLSQQGIHYTNEPSIARILVTFLGLQLRLRWQMRSPLSLLASHEHPHIHDQMRLISKMMSLVYNAAPQLFPLLIFRLVALSIRYGHTQDSAFAYAGYGLLLCGFFGMFEQGFAISQRAFKLLEQIPHTATKARVLMVHYSFTHHWKRPMRECLPHLLEGYRVGVEAGELEFASYCASVHGAIILVSGTSLEVASQAMRENIARIKELGHHASLLPAQLYYQVLLNLQNDDGSIEQATQLEGESYGESTSLQEQQDANNLTTTYDYYAHKGALCYLFGDVEQALACAKEAQKYIEGSMGTVGIVYGAFFEALSCSAMLKKDTSAKALRKTWNTRLKHFRNWARHAPSNYQQKYDILLAEEAALKREPEKAAALYEKAIQEASKNQFSQDEALANELAAQLFLSQGQPRRAVPFLYEAALCYHRWGARAKVSHLLHLYRSTFDLLPTWKRSLDLLQREYDLPTEEEEPIEIKALLKSSAALASESPQQDTLQDQLKIAVEYAGAQRGCLLFLEAGQWFITVHDSEEKSSHEYGSLEAANRFLSPPLSESVIEYVWRIKEPLLLGDASSHPLLKQEVSKWNPKPISLCCLPIFVQGDCKGLLYIENNALSYVFTVEQVEVLSLLASQATAGLENNRLYNLLEERVQERTVALEQDLLALEQNHSAYLRSQEHVFLMERSASLAAIITNLAKELSAPVTLSTQELQRLCSRVDKLRANLKQDPSPQTQMYDRLHSIKKQLSTLEGSLSTVASLQKQILSFSEINEEASQRVRLVEPLRQAVEHIGGSLAEGSQTTVCIRPPNQEDQEAYVDGWHGQLYQAFVHLLQNSLEACEAKGPSQQGTIEVFWGRKDSHWHISFKDNGVGIPEALHPRIFEPFFSTKPSAQGMGLPLVYQITQRHKGELDFISSEQGSLFCMCLPAA